MSPTASLANHQQRCIDAYRNNSGHYCFFNVLIFSSAFASLTWWVILSLFSKIMILSFLASNKRTHHALLLVEIAACLVFALFPSLLE